MKVTNQQRWDDAKLHMKGFCMILSFLALLFLVSALDNGQRNIFTVLGAIIMALTLVSLGENIRHRHK